ncbi:hypothetical protein [Flagellimonas sp.]|jgi:sugar-specific transcriptional regulator TrmB|uniref:hypothetical protein n=1 Tax=Flagellimonas sp. TaxID=2058762 RepID=UPI003BAA603F
MAIDNIYDESEFDGLAPNLLQQKGQEIKQRFDQRRNFYNSLRNNQIDFDKWITLNKELSNFDKTKFPNWNNQWNNVYRTSNINSYTSYFNQGIDLFKEFEENADLENYKPTIQHSDGIEELKAELIEKIDSDMVTIKNSIIESVNEGIQNVVNLKAELGLSKNFADNLEKDRKTANITRFAFLGAFILSILIIGIWVIFSYDLKIMTDLELYEKIAVKIGVAIPLGFLSYFFFNQFKIYQLIHLKYSHLSNFLGGGATYISQLIGQDTESRKTTNQKLATMFMEIDDLMSTIKKQKHPTDSTFENGNKTINTILNRLSEISKNLNEIKKP